MRALPALPLILIGAVAAGQEEEITGAYVGGGGAIFDHEQELERVPCGEECGESVTAIKLYGGYRLSDFWSLEGTYNSSERAEDLVEGVLPGIGFVTGTAGAEFDALSFRAIRHFPLFWGSFIVGAGAFAGDWDTLLEADDGVTVHRFADSSSENGLTATIGLQADFDAWSLRVEYEWWDVENADPVQLAFGAHYRF